MCFGYLAEFGVSVLVVGEVYAALLDFICAQCMEYALGDDCRTVIHVHDFALYDGRNHQIHDFIDRDFGFVEHLGDYYHRIVAGGADTECEVAGAASHGRKYEPVAACACVHVYGASDDSTLVLC